MTGEVEYTFDDGEICLAPDGAGVSVNMKIYDDNLSQRVTFTVSTREAREISDLLALISAFVVRTQEIKGNA